MIEQRLLEDQAMDTAQSLGSVCKAARHIEHKTTGFVQAGSAQKSVWRLDRRVPAQSLPSLHDILNTALDDLRRALSRIDQAPAAAQGVPDQSRGGLQ